MTTDLEANLSWARQAVHYVKDHISVGNKWIQGDMEDIGALAKKWVPLLGLKAVDLLTYLSEITRLSLATKLGVEWDPHLWILSPVERNQREIEDLAETMHWGPSAVICDAWMARRSSYETSSDERERGYYVSSRLWSNMKLSSRRLAPQVRFEETDI
jgi:hypothetical protein